MTVVLVGLHDREGDDGSESASNIEECVILLVRWVIKQDTLVIRASQAVLRVFTKP